MSIEAISPNPATNAEEAQELFVDLLGHHGSDGWSWGAGDPEIHTNKGRLLVAGGSVLDLGIGHGRSSLFFALHGMSVEGLDSSCDNVLMVNNLAEAYNLPISARVADILKEDFGAYKYDMVLMADIFHHFASKQAAFEVIKKGIRSLKTDGYLWLRAPGKMDSGFIALVENSEAKGAQHMGDDVFMGPCICSGELKDEYILFFDQLDLPIFVQKNGAQIVESRIAPIQSVKNRMFGEDWDSRKTGWLNGEVSILAKKR